MFFRMPIFLDFYWFWVPQGSILGGFLDHFSENEKVCLDCTGVCGLHIQPLVRSISWHNGLSRCWINNALQGSTNTNVKGNTDKRHRAASSFPGFIEVFFLGLSWFWVTRFSWFWMILEARGLVFWWFLNILGAWEPLLQAWSIFWPKARISMILETWPPWIRSPFWGSFLIFFAFNF